MKSGYSEHDQSSAPQIFERHGGSLYPEVAHKEPRAVAEFSSVADEGVKQRYDQDNHAEASRKTKKKRIIIICAVVFAILTAAAAGALGGFFGSKKTRNDAIAR